LEPSFFSESLREYSEGYFPTRKQRVEDEIAKILSDNENVKILMNIHEINVYSAAAIMSEIDDIH